jgi:hypothetical protein
MKKYFFLLAALTLIITGAFSQSIAINEDGSLPNPHAILDIKSSTKGVLIPRMSSVARLAIPNTKGLLVYDTDNNLFWYNTGTAWQTLTTASSSGNGWLITGNSGTQDTVNFLGTTDNTPLNIRVNNQPSGKIDGVKANTYWGFQAGKSDSIGTSNTATGYQSLSSNTTGSNNVSYGVAALRSNTTGESNSAVGYISMIYNTTGSCNTADGTQTLFLNTSGSFNTAFGCTALSLNSIGSENTAIGNLAMFYNKSGYKNTAIGNRALATNVSGFSNVAVGVDALYSGTNTINLVAIGDSALYNNLKGIQNTAVGSKAMYSNTSGAYNTALGYKALFQNTLGIFNTADGYKALTTNSTGNNNTADGYEALSNNQTGLNNTASGTYALKINKTGANNTADGYLALSVNKAGSNLTAIGSNSDVSNDNLTNATAIGAGTLVDASNKVRIGNTSVTVIEGQVPFTTPSDGRFKFNVRENVKGLDFILKLRPVTYQFDVKKEEYFTRGILQSDQLANYIRPAGNDEATQMIRTGFIAQEVEQAAKKSSYSFDGVKAPKTEKEYYSLSYSSFVVPLVKAVQEQQEIIQAQNLRISNLEQEIAEIKKLVQVSH